MRKLLAIGMCLGIFLSGAMASAENTILRDPGDAFPWGAEIPFPWKGMQGTWDASINGTTNYFSFKLLKSGNGVNQMKIRQYDANCSFLGEGAGYEQDKFVEALMITENTAYSLKVHVFKESDLKSAGYQGNMMVRGVKTVTVLRMAPLSDKDGSQRTYQLFKVSSDPKGVCDY